MWIRIQSLSFFAHHGVYDEEQNLGNHFEVDVDIAVPDTFGGSDSLESTLDYVRVFDAIEARSVSKRYMILERLCADMCQDIIELDHAIGEVIVHLRKLNPPAKATVKYVEIVRRLTR